MEIINFNQKYLAQVAVLYDQVFMAPPWNDKALGLETAMAYIQSELDKPIARASLAIADSTPVGFAWGYQSNGFPESKYEPENRPIINSIIPNRSFFYISEVGVSPDFRRQKIGSELIRRLVQDENLLMRTLNVSPMLNIALNQLKMTPIISPNLYLQDPENPNRVILIKYG